MGESFWRGKRVLLTGHTGFKGAWLALWLQRVGAEVTGYALDPPTEPSLHALARVAERMHDLRGDVRDAQVLARAFDAASPEIVIHMAAQSLVRRSYAEPVQTFETNVMGTVNVLEAVRHAPNVRVALVVTSDKCYENRDATRARAEGDPMGGDDLYSSSKAAAELVTAAYRRSFFQRGAAIASARAGNVIGGGDWAKDRLIPDALRCFAGGEPLRLRFPAAVRPWQHVLEPLSGYLRLAEALLGPDGAGFAAAWNFGPADRDMASVGDVAAKIATLWGEGARVEPSTERHPHEAGLLMLDSRRAHAALAWRPRWSLEQALARTVAWQRDWHAGADMQATTRGQIDAYLSTKPA
jgi:CDP-glucose 4,6-dehydratase